MSTTTAKPPDAVELNGLVDQNEQIIPNVVVEPKPSVSDKNKLWKSWAAVLSYTLSLLMYFVSLLMNIFLGIQLLEGEGKVILVLLFSPAVATFVLVLYQKIYFSIHGKNVWDAKKGYKYTLLGIDWLSEHNSKEEAFKENYNHDAAPHKASKLQVAFNVILVILRLNTLQTYIKYFKRLDEKKTAKQNVAVFRNSLNLSDKSMKRYCECELKLRGELFLQTVFETLPQTCLQMYIFGQRSMVSVLHITSFTFSTFNLCLMFIKFQVKRWNDMVSMQKDNTVKSILEDIPEEETGPCIKKVTCVVESLHPPEKVEIEFKTSDDGQATSIKYIQLTKHQFNVDFYWYINVVNDVIGSPLFFLTAHPTISFFSSIFGHNFMVLFLPITLHFIVLYWWWRPKTDRRLIQFEFQIMYLAFKVFLRTMILAMISIWFIRIVEYYKPEDTPVPAAVPRLVYPTPNRFLQTIAKYQKDNSTRGWTHECERVQNNLNVTIVSNRTQEKEKEKDNASIFKICASHAAMYIFCVIFYVNCIGIAWEFIHFFLFMFLKWHEKMDADNEKVPTSFCQCTKGVTESCKDAHEERQPLTEDELINNISIA